MSKWREIYNSFRGDSYSTRVYTGQLCLYTVEHFAEVLFKGDNYYTSLITSLRPYIVTNGTLSKNKFEYMRDVFGISCSYNEFLKFYSDCSNDQTSGLVELLPTFFTGYAKQAFATLGMLICCADGSLTFTQKRKFEEYLTTDFQHE